MPSTQLGFAVRNSWQAGCEKQRAQLQHTDTHTADTQTGTQNTRSVYSHKCEYSHDGCGDKQLRRQNQIHLKKHTRREKTGGRYISQSLIWRVATWENKLRVFFIVQWMRYLCMQRVRRVFGDYTSDTIYLPEKKNSALFCDLNIMIIHERRKLELNQHGVCNKCVLPSWWRRAEYSDCPNRRRSPQTHHLCHQ